MHSPFPYPTDLTAPGAIDALLAYHRQLAGDLVMEDPPAGPQGDGQNGAQGSDSGQTGGDTGQGGNGGQSGGQGSQAGDGRSFSQADLDRIVSERVTAERKRHEQAIADEREKAGKSAEEKAALEQQQRERDAKEKITAAQTRAVQAEAKGVARDLGARPDRLAAILKQADLTEAMSDDGDLDEAKVKAAVEAVLKDYPEWKAEKGTTKSGGELGGGGGEGKPTFTRKQIQDMSSEERVRRIDEINAAAADGRITG